VPPTGRARGKTAEPLAGTIKRTLRREIIDRSLVLETEHDVYLEVLKIFGSEEWAESHEQGKISRINVMWLDSKDIVRPVQGAVDVDQVRHRELGIGVRKLFSYAVGNYDAGTSTTSLVLKRFSCGCNACLDVKFDDDWDTATPCAVAQRRDICPLRRRDNRGVAARKRQELQRALTLAESLNVGDYVALETGDYRRTQREGGGSMHAFLLARVMEQRGSGGKGYVVADDRATRTHDNEEYRPGDPVVLVRLFDRTAADTRRFTVGDRIYRANGRSVLRKLDSGDGREDQPVVGGATAVAPRATYTITSAAEREITTAAAH
jgi:hypothetical protein